MSAAAYTAARYLVSWAFMYLAQRGWSVANVDGATLDAVTQLVIGLGGAAGMLAIGVWRSTLPVLIARLQRHHAPALVAAATEVVTAQPALATKAMTVP